MQRVTDPRLAASPAASAAWMPAETEAVRATTTELPLVPGHMSSPEANVIVKGATQKLTRTISPSQPSTAVPPSSRPVEIQK